MACGAYPTSPIEYFLNWRFVDGVVCYFGDQVGVTVFMLLFFGATFLALYESTGSLVVPAVVLLAMAPLVMFIIPAIGVKLVVVIMFIVVTIAGFWIYSSVGRR